MWFQAIVIAVSVVVLIGMGIAGYKFAQRLVASVNSAIKRVLEIEVAVKACSQTLEGLVSSIEADDGTEGNTESNTEGNTEGNLEDVSMLEASTVPVAAPNTVTNTNKSNASNAHRPATNVNQQVNPHASTVQVARQQQQQHPHKQGQQQQHAITTSAPNAAAHAQAALARQNVKQDVKQDESAAEALATFQKMMEQARIQRQQQAQQQAAVPLAPGSGPGPVPQPVS